MSEGADSARRCEPEGEGEDVRAVERRIFRDMCVAAALAALASSFLAPWRVTTGIVLGGALAVFNHHWLRSSVAAVFGATPEGARPKLRAARYVLRYVVIAAVVVVAVKLDVVSVAATLAGMCSVVAGLLAEGFRQLYFAVVSREES